MATQEGVGAEQLCQLIFDAGSPEELEQLREKFAAIWLPAHTYLRDRRLRRLTEQLPLGE